MSSSVSWPSLAKEPQTWNSEALTMRQQRHWFNFLSKADTVTRCAGHYLGTLQWPQWLLARLLPSPSTSILARLTTIVVDFIDFYSLWGNPVFFCEFTGNFITKGACRMSGPFCSKTWSAQSKQTQELTALAPRSLAHSSGSLEPSLESSGWFVNPTIWG